MRMHIICGVYPPEPVTSAGISRDLAVAMTQRGHEITVFAPFPTRPTGNVMSNYHRRWRHVEYRNGYRIIHCWHTLSKRSTLTSRLAENISFGLTSTLQLMREPAPDVVYMVTWPIFAQWTNTYILARRRVPVICAVKDLFPESFFSIGRMSETNPIMQLAAAVDAQVHKRSALVAALNPIMQERIITSRGIAANKVCVWYDWVDAARFPKNQSKDGDFRRKHDLSTDLFIAMYVGSLARTAGLELYVQAAERLRHRHDIRILLVGDGAMREELQAMIQQRGLQNIRVIYPLKPEEVPEVQAASDVLILSLSPGAAEHALPSKIIFYLFSQRPVLASVEENGPPARVIREAQCGSLIHQGDPHDLAKKLENMADDHTSLQRLGDNARRYAEEHFLKENILPRVCNLIEQIGQHRF
jgi:colanic acid biosynthesis glycosyl transferase WcaI